MTTVVPPLLSGTLFGSALTASSVYLPSVIRSQLSLTGTVMFKTFLTASSCSAIIIYLSNKLGYATLPFRTNTSYGWFGSYDANLVGGILQGLGMALTGACPGTVLVQVALGIRPARWTLLGSLLGGLAFILVSDRLRRVPAETVTEKEHTVMQRLKIPDEGAVLAYEVLLITAIAGIDRLGLSRDGQRFWLDPVTGGMLIGIAQASSVLLLKKTLGVSSAYSELASHVKSILKDQRLGGSFGNICFACGVIFGARLASHRIPLVVENGPSVGSLTAIFGGFCSIFGARLAGGCTSGHGISGMSTLSISSFVTVMGMFGGGVASTKLLEVV